MPRVMKTVTIFSLSLTVVMSALYFWLGSGIYLTFAITFGTTFYHFAIRLSVGFICNIVMNNRADYTKWRYRVGLCEYELYKFLHVKKWKDKMPTYNPENFSVKNHTLDEIAQVMCQSETVHEANVLLSFVPILAAKFFGAFYVFLITSVCGAVFDLLLVIVQRYNRARAVKIISKSACRKNLH